MQLFARADIMPHNHHSAEPVEYLFLGLPLGLLVCIPGCTTDLLPLVLALLA